MKRLLQDAGVISPGLSTACDKVFDACEICVSSGRLIHTKNLSLIKLGEALNFEIQAAFTVIYIYEHSYEVLNIVYMGTTYGERSIASARSVEMMTNLCETEWIYKHGAPQMFSADPEFFLHSSDVS